EWLADLEPGARLAWVELLCYAKNEGLAGTVKKMSPAVFGRRFAIPAADVRAMLDAAIDHGAIEDTGDAWVIVTWATYQPKDATAAARMRKYRNEKSQLSPLRVTGANRGEHPRNPSRATKTTKTTLDITDDGAKAPLSDESDARSPNGAVSAD